MSRFLFFLLASLILVLPARSSQAAEPIRLREAFPAGYTYHVSCRVDLTGSLTLPASKEQPEPKPIKVTGNSVIEYDERVLEVTGQQVGKTLRIYRQFQMDRKMGDQPQDAGLRAGVRRLVLVRMKNTEVPFSPDGPLTWHEIDLIRTDVFTPALTGLLPDHPVRPGDRWTAATAAVQELTDMERIDEGKLECRLQEITTLSNRRHARVAVSGSVRGINEDGPNRQQLDGWFFFDLESNHLSYLTLKGTHMLLDKDGKEAGRVEGRFVLTRQANQQSADLADPALRGVELKPNADNTTLLYDNAELGVRFLYPRRWRVGQVQGRQITLDEPKGSGLLLTLEPLARVPTGKQFLAESRGYLEKQKANILRVDLPQPAPDFGSGAEHLALDVAMSGQRLTLEYYILRQDKGGAIIAARLGGDDLASLRKDVERMVKSLQISRAPIERGASAP